MATIFQVIKIMFIRRHTDDHVEHINMTQTKRQKDKCNSDCK